MPATASRVRRAAPNDVHRRGRERFVQPVGPEVVVRRGGDGGHRHARGRERGRQRIVERQALERVVRVPRHVQVPAHPSRARLGVEFADLPVVAAGEVALVGRVVADRREHGDLALGVERREPSGLWMPHQRFVLAEQHAFPFVAAERRAKFVVPGFLDGREHAQRVPSAFHEDRHQHRLFRRSLRSGRRDPLFEAARRERGGTVDREHGPGGAQQERAPVHAGARRQRHARARYWAARVRPGRYPRAVPESG